MFGAIRSLWCRWLRTTLVCCDCGPTSIPWTLWVASTLVMTLPVPLVQMPLVVQFVTVRSVIVMYEPPTSRQSPVNTGLAPAPYAPIVMGEPAVPFFQTASLPTKVAPRSNSTWSPGPRLRPEARPAVLIALPGEVPLLESEPEGET